jgi:phage shock protein PspC (stress-responsive transcriptional regulator)
MTKLKYFIEQRAFGVCTALGERMRISSDKIRLWFVYISFFTLGSPIIIYFVLAFWRQMRNYIRTGKRNPLNS